MCSLVEKWGFFDRKLPLPERGEMGVFGPRNPLFQEMGIRAPVWGQGNRSVFTYSLKFLFFTYSGRESPSNRHLNEWTVGFKEAQL